MAATGLLWTCQARRERVFARPRAEVGFRAILNALSAVSSASRCHKDHIRSEGDIQNVHGLAAVELSTGDCPQLHL